MEIAARFLAARPRTRWEIERRLRRAGADDDLVGATIGRLAALGYVDDLAFARWWLEQRDRHAPRGRRLVETELRQRGVPREVIVELRGAHALPEDASVDAFADTGSIAPDEPKRAAQALARHLRGRAVPDDPHARQRLGAFLMRRGFDPETARDAIRDAARQAGSSVDADD